MKIIKQGELSKSIIFQATCDQCETVFEFEEHEANEIRTRVEYATFIKKEVFAYINCPICENLLCVSNRTYRYGKD